MSRSQQNTVNQTAAGENQSYNANANTSYNNAQQDEGNYENDLAKYASSNPYVQGGQFQTAENQQMSNTADAGSQAAGNAIQSSAVRTGQNPAGAIAATEAISEANTRNLGAAEGAATQQRISSESGYNQNVLNAQQQPASFEAQLAGQQGGLAQGALGTQEQSAQSPSFMDELGNSILGAGQQIAGGYGKSLGCWVAAELYGGWYEPRTVMVRNWLFGSFAKTRIGAIVADQYMKHGPAIAELVREHLWVRRAIKPIFDLALRHAEKQIQRKGVN